MRRCLQTLTFCLLFLLLNPDIRLPSSVITAQNAPSTRELLPFEAVTDFLSAEDMVHDWTFTAKRGQFISIIAEQQSGTLDVVIELYNADGRLLAANDNASFDTLNARIEALPIPNDDQYRIRVYREGMGNGNTSGEYELLLTWGYSTFDNTVPAAITTDSDAVNDIFLPTTPFYITATVRLPISDSQRIIWRIADPTTIVWVFEHSINGDWAIAIENAAGEILRSTNGNSPLLSPENGILPLRFWREESGLQILVEETPVTSIAPVQNLIQSQTGTVQVQSLDSNVAEASLVLINNFRVTTAFYADTPFNAGAVSPTTPGQRIYDFTGDPAVVVSELRELGFAPDPTATSGLQGNIISSFILNDAASFNAYPLIERPFQNFVLSFSARITGGTDRTACGVIFRQNAPETFATLLFTPSRGLYVLQYDGGNLIGDGVATVSERLLPGNDRTNHFVIVANGDNATVFVNGRFEDVIRITETAGLTLSHLALDADLPTYCQLDNLWMWILD